MEKISTTVHGQCWISHENLHVLVEQLARCAKGFEMMMVVWNRWLTWMQHLNSQSDWLWWQCNGRTYNEYRGFLCAFWVSQPGQCHCSPALSKWSKQIKSMSACLCPENMYFLWLTPYEHFTATNPFFIWSLLHYVLSILETLETPLNIGAS